MKTRAWLLVGIIALSFEMLGVPGNAQAQSSPSPYLTAYRYQTGQSGLPLRTGLLVGTISPAPSGQANFLATRNTYDTNGRLSEIETGVLAAWQADSILPANWTGFTVAKTETFTYDTDGRVIEDVSTGSDGNPVNVTQKSYDAFDRLTCTAVRMNSSAFGSLPADGCTLGTPPGPYGQDRITKTVYDNLNRAIQIRKAVGTASEEAYATFTYSDGNLPQRIIDANGNETLFAYDGVDRLQYLYFPSPTPPSAYNPTTQATALSTAGATNFNDFELYGYDPNGNRISLQKRDGSVIGYQYDALNRMTFKDIPGGTVDDVYYAYDLRGLKLSEFFGLTTGAGPSATGITTVYDGFGRVNNTINNSDGYSRQLSYQYDADGNRQKITHPDGMVFTYAYDGMNRMQYICETTSPCTAAASPIVTLAYDAQGRRSTLTRGTNAASTSYSYDPDSRPQTMSFNLDGSGTANDVNFGFTYTPGNQIASRNISIGAFANSNSPGISATYVPNGLNQYTSIFTTTAMIPTWDANGNLKYDGSSSNYSYDEENRLITAANTTSGVTASLDYDPRGRLLETSTGTAASQTDFLYDGDALVAEYNSSGTLLRRYVQGPGVDEPLVWYEGSTVGAANRNYLFENYQGSIAAVANSAGATTQVNTYDVYGIPGTSNAGRFQYTGQIRIPEIGMYYYKARIYNPTMGRFLQTDPIGYDADEDLYSYVGNDPLNRTDPAGTAPCPTFAAGQSSTPANCPITGNAQVTGDPNHAPAGREDAQRLAANGKYSSVHLNQTLATISGNPDAGLERPDVAGVVKDTGAIDTVEHISPTQTAAGMDAKGAGMQAKLAAIGRAGTHESRTPGQALAEAGKPLSGAAGKVLGIGGSLIGLVGALIDAAKNPNMGPVEFMYHASGMTEVGVAVGFLPPPREYY